MSEGKSPRSITQFFPEDKHKQILHEVENHWNRYQIGLIYFDIVQFGMIEENYGREVCDQILAILEKLFSDVEKRYPDILCTYRTLGDDFFVYLKLKEEPGADPYVSLKQFSQKIYVYIKHELNQATREFRVKVDFHISFTLLVHHHGKSIESSLYNAIKKVLKEAKQIQTDTNPFHLEEFQQILSEKKIEPLFQPIASLSTGVTFGYEALTRGPKNSFFYSPVSLFDFAEKEGYLYALEKLARELALKHGASFLEPSQKLFVNLNSQVIYDPEFTPGNTVALLEKYHLSPKNVVFEITERSAISDFDAFKKVLEHYRNQGFQIAIDDTGAGYSSLQAISELKPDYIKIDKSLIQGIEHNRVKENIVESLVHFSRKINCKVIAEGIETHEELGMVIRLGVHFGQGFFLSRPGFPPPLVSDEARECIERYRRMEHLSSQQTTIGEICTPVKVFKSGTLTALIAQYFSQVPWDLGVVIVKEGHIPVGLVMKAKLNQVLATQYGSSLYLRHPINRLMDSSPLVVESSLTIDAVAQLAMSRVPEHVYDLVIVVENGILKGAVSIQTILDYYANVKMEILRFSNPLTGLPGNTQINKMIELRLAGGEPFALIYADLDHFKWYNDQYGFQRGDQLIKHLADILQQTLSSIGGNDHFLGHVGGDDFIIITPADQGRRISEEIISRFEEAKPQFYDNPEEMSRPILDRNGRPLESNGISISLAVLECHNPAGLDVEQIAKRAAKLKKEAKARMGSCFVAERIQ